DVRCTVQPLRGSEELPAKAVGDHHVASNANRVHVPSLRRELPARPGKGRKARCATNGTSVKHGPSVANAVAENVMGGIGQARERAWQVGERAFLGDERGGHGGGSR